jgi:lipopolysaccharide transport system ATP-binding protein
MSDTVIEVNNVSKQYRLGMVGTTSIGDDIRRFWARIKGLEDPTLKVGHSNVLSQKQTKFIDEYIWALKGVSFDVKQGEVLGIIGKNGAGKSTLLKILSKVTSPTQGDIKINGRIASLLEVGTGFHSELTGRENIFLNGAILGMTKVEIRSKFDEIVDFSGVERYIDTPVKRYSSGMYVRLAFAVAAHLEPEILILDEVLAVGDAEFQKKCFGKMKDVSDRDGRTVIFVSHNMAAVQRLCSSALVLVNGSVTFTKGDVYEAVKYYLQALTKNAAVKPLDRTDRTGEGRIIIENVGIYDSENRETNYPVSGQDIEFRIFYCMGENAVFMETDEVEVAISVSTYSGNFITYLDNRISAESFRNIHSKGYFGCRIKKLPLYPDKYVVNISLSVNGKMQDWIQEAFVFEVEYGDFFNTGMIQPQSHAGILIEQTWENKEI